jgi:filamentous hemagglutinin family protein
MTHKAIATSMVYLSEKVAARRRVLMTGMLVSSALVSPSAIAGSLPTGGSFAAGAGAIAVTGNHMTVHQSGGRAIVNWDSFSISANSSVAFDNGSGATLNRVTGSQMSSIAGSLTGTGSVYLVNPQGVAVEAGGKVVVGGSFVASSLDVPDSQFMAGGALRFKGDGRGSVTNAGSITSTYGDVLLIGATVSNEGKLNAPRGTAGLAGGTDILVNGQTAQGGRVFVEVAGSGSVTNSGDVQGAMAELQAAGGNVYALAGNNGGQIRATGVGTRDGKVWLTASGGSVINAASVSAVRADGTGGVVSISAAQLVSNTGAVAAEGTEGGAVSVAAANVINQGNISATGSDRGGAVSIAASSSYVDTGGSKLAADGGSGQAGSIAIGGTGTGFSSGTISARSDSGQGGEVAVTTAATVLVDAHLDASGGSGGGKIRVGGTDFHGGAGARSTTTTVSATTTLKADATHSGSGGSVVVWSDKTTSYGGSISATGKTGAGKAEVSSGGTLGFAGAAQLDAANGELGSLLLDPKFITISDSAGAIGTKLLDPREGVGANAFGAITLALASGNMVVTAPGDSAGGANAGAVYVFNSTTGALVSALTGSQAGDQVGLTGVTALTGGNFVVRSANWNAARGAVTFGSGTTGVSGVVSSANSLVGGAANDQVGATGIATSSAGYVVRSSNWNGTMGAVSFGTLTAGVSGVVSSANSLVGSTVGDQVGSTGVTALSNGNFIVLSPNWNGKRGAATLIDSTVGLSGVVSASNSLVGSAVNDRVGAGAIVLSKGNVIIRNPFWTGNIGAATWMSGTAGLTGVVSSANSLVGSIAGDQVGSGGFALSGNGNAIITSANWNGKRGAATWIDGATGLTGAVSSANSLVGSSVNDTVGSSAVALGNGNAVIGSANWSGGFGAATWVDGTAGLTGAVSSSNSLVGSSVTDKIGATITALRNNDYVVRSATWNGNRGAVTWGSGTAGVISVVSSANSLVGSTAGDQIGLSGVILLANGGYVVGSANWNGAAGAATFGAARAGVSGAVSAANSLVGSLAGDKVGSAVTALANSSYVVSSPTWNGNMGAATFGAAGTGVVGTVSSSNSLVGSAAGDQVGSVVVGLSNSAYVVGSAAWNGNRGAATYGGTAGISGVVSQSNSLVGTTAGDQVGSGITGIGVNYIVRSPNWNGGMGAATWIGSATNTTGAVSAANSLVGSTAGDQVGSSVTVVGNTYVVSSALWNGGRGAVTWAGGSTGISGVVSASNSLVGSTANAGLTYAGASGNLIFARSSTDGGSGRVYSYYAGAGPTTFGASSSSSSTMSTATLNNLLSQRSNVTLQANDDITVASAITVTGGTGGTLTLDAGRSLYINADITTGNGGLTLIANERLSSGVVDAERDPGAAGITMAAGAKINAGTGAVSINLRDGRGLTNPTGGDITLGRIAAGTVTINNQKGGIVFNDAVSSRNGVIAAANGGDLTLQSGARLTAAGTGDAIRLATTGQFTNNAGGLALSAANGRWLVYTADLPKATAGGLSASPFYGRAFNYGNLGSNTLANKGNRFVYRAAKTLTVTGDTKYVFYNGATQLDSYTISGLVGSDLAANAYRGAAAIMGVKNVGGYNITPGRGTLTSDYGYTFSFKTGRLTVVMPRLGADPAIMPVLNLPEALSIDSLAEALVRANRPVASTASTARSPDAEPPADLHRPLVPDDRDTAESWFANGRSHVIYQIEADFAKNRGAALAGISSFEEAFLEPNASVLYIRQEDLVSYSQNDAAR